MSGIARMVSYVGAVKEAIGIINFAKHFQNFIDDTLI